VGFTRNIATDRAVLGSLLDRLALPSSLISPILAHARAVERDAARLGLVSPGDAQQVVRRHSADSLLFALARRPAAAERWVDVGSGAGFPGLVLACCFPDTEFCLVEPLQKRAGFLQLTAANLGLNNLSVIPSRLDQAKLAPCDVAVARALSDPVSASSELLASVRPGGAALVAIGSEEGVAPGARLIRVGKLDNVDSPGLFSMMTLEE
jgi:16S rRNA (guanine(527)-N(7))-methyltransferase RsmG